VTDVTGDRFVFEDAKKFILSEWDRVWKTKASLEQRAITLITVSGVLVTLAFGFSTAITKSSKHANFTPAERIVLVIALALFAISAILSLVVNMPYHASVPDLSDVLRITDRVIPGAPLERLDAAIEDVKAHNYFKANLLALAFSVQLAGVATLAVVVGIVTA
jgi:uncharacterized protein with PQ loop repeat